MVLQYLDVNGYPMKPEEKPIFLRDKKKAPSTQRVARYITCPETGMLKWIGHCEDCKEFKGHVKYNGVNCAYKNLNNYGRKNNAPKNQGAIRTKDDTRNRSGDRKRCRV